MTEVAYHKRRLSLKRSAISAWNAFVTKLASSRSLSADQDLAAIRRRAAAPTDISSHLETIYREGLRCRPKLIVELGVRGGESTFVLERVARKCDAVLVSVDLAEASSACAYDKWYFVQDDDVSFGKRFPQWCADGHLSSTIDLLIVDTSHLYDHTVAEIDVWLPHLAPCGTMIFHDTNLKGLYRRRDWTLGVAWDNDRGVIRALEQLLGQPLGERKPFSREIGLWHVAHDPLCNGLTVLRHRCRSGDSEVLSAAGGPT